MNNKKMNLLKKIKSIKKLKYYLIKMVNLEVILLIYLKIFQWLKNLK
jgi:hypothetical protein